MANTIDNKLKGFDSGSFRKTSGDSEKELFEAEVNGNESDIGVNLPPMVIDVKKLLEVDTNSQIFNSGMDSTSKKAVYDGIYGVIKDDMSMKGTTLKNKKDLRDFFIKDCAGLGGSTREKFGLSSEANGYSILAMMLALACNGVKDIVSAVLDTFPDTISKDAVKNVLPRLMEVHDGNDAVDLIKDMANNDDIIKTLNTHMLEPAEEMISLFNKDKDTVNRMIDSGDKDVVGPKVPKLDILKDALDKLTDSNWDRPDIPVADTDIHGKDTGLFNSDSISQVSSKDSGFNPDSIDVPSRFDIHDTLSLFDTRQTNRRIKDNKSVDEIISTTDSLNKGPIFSNIIDTEGNAFILDPILEYTKGVISEEMTNRDNQIVELL